MLHPLPEILVPCTQTMDKELGEARMFDLEKDEDNEAVIIHMPHTRIQCQIYGKFKHTTLKCKQRFNYNFIVDDIPQTSAAVSHQEPSKYSTWHESVQSHDIEYRYTFLF